MGETGEGPQAPGRSNSPARIPAMNPVHSEAAKVSTGLFASFESRTSTAAVTFATSTQWPAAALRVLLRQVRLAYRMTVPFQDGCASISAHQAATKPECFLPFSDD